MKRRIPIFILLILWCTIAFSSIPSSNRIWIKTGSMQNCVDAWGGERGWNVNKSIYEGMRWPAWYDRTDNFVIDRPFMACRDFRDTTGVINEYQSVKFTAYSDMDQFIPQSLIMTGRFYNTLIRVNGETQIVEYPISDTHTNMSADRIVTNTIRTRMGITITRKVLAFSQQYHDNYHIVEYTFENTGNIDDDDDIELTGTINDFYYGLISRFSTSREVYYVNNMRQGSWGAHQWVHHTPMSEHPDLPYYYTWIGQAKTLDITLNYDNVGIPFLPSEGDISQARLRGYQFAGLAVLHCDQSYYNTANSTNKVRLGWYIGDEIPVADNHEDIWNLLTDNYSNLGTFDIAQDDYANHKIADRLAPFIVNNHNTAGTNSYVSFGPYDIPWGESIRIVVCEAVSGIDREKATEVGRNWYRAYNGETVDLTLPAAPVYHDADPVDPDAPEMDIYKDSWVYTGKDSIIKTFLMAKNNYESGYDIILPPPPPASFEIISRADRIDIEWSSNAESDPNFEGYRLYRAVGASDSIYYPIFECSATAGNIVHGYSDTDVLPDRDYYYYIASYSDDAVIGELESGRAYTQTTLPAAIGVSAIGDPAPTVFQLNDNYPNPFNPITTISYVIPESAKVRLSVYDINGTLMQTVIDQDQAPGTYTIHIDASAFPSGLYIYRLETNQQVLTKKMLLLK